MGNSSGHGLNGGNEADAEEVVAWRGSDIFFTVALVLLFVLGLVFSVLIFNYALYNQAAAAGRGPWGDFIGGTLNPMLTFFSFLGVLISILLQRFDLSLSRVELRRSADALERQIQSIEAQNFEASFFQMLSAFNSIVESVDLIKSDTGAVTRGRDCFRFFYTRLNKIFRDNEKKGGPKLSGESILRLSYCQFWKQYDLELGHYYRFLFNILKFLDESPMSKPRHAKLLRAQLSDQELLLLFYNCISEQGRSFEKYAVKYEIFDNLPTIKLLDDSHIRLIDNSSFGSNPMHNSKGVKSSFL